MLGVILSGLAQILWTLLWSLVKYLSATLWASIKYLWSRGLDNITYGVTAAVSAYLLLPLGWDWLRPHFTSTTSASFIRETVGKEVPLLQQLPAVLKRIAACESSNQHFKDGTVRRGDIDKDDIGRYQINLRYWSKAAQRLGYDVFNEQDNERMALWIYEKHGTWPWDASKPCWK